jgi:hypothetical protein
MCSKYPELWNQTRPVGTRALESVRGKVAVSAQRLPSKRLERMVQLGPELQ